MVKNVKRVFISLPLDVYDKVVTWAARLGVSQSHLSSMALQAGLDSILRAYSPLEGIPPEQIAKIAVAMKAQGLDVKVPKVAGGAKKNASSRKTAKAKSH